jgi:3-deoxy-7-phosphoheptulonate synthase
VDPSHAAGKREWVECLTLAGVACGGDGLLIETHPEPEKALSDGPQAVVLSEFATLLDKARRVAVALGRTIAVGSPVPAAR